MLTGAAASGSSSTWTATPATGWCSSELPASGIVERADEWPEVVPGDLRRRPPELVEADDGRLGGMCEVVPHELRAGSGEQHSAQHGTEGLWNHVGAGSSRDLLGCDVGLLGGDALPA